MSLDDFPQVLSPGMRREVYGEDLVKITACLDVSTKHTSRD